MFEREFKALADPTRREILRQLAAGEQSAGELAGRFDLTKPSISHHFGVLKSAGLVRARREGANIYYSLDTTVAADLAAWVWDLFGPRRPPGSDAAPPEAAAETEESAPAGAEGEKP